LAAYIELLQGDNGIPPSGNEMPCDHRLEGYPDANIKSAAVADDRKRPLFRWYMVRRRAWMRELQPRIGLHTFRGTGIPTI
jgi:hypothetical protein